MMKLLTLLAATVLAFGVIAPAMAQQPGPGARPGARPGGEGVARAQMLAEIRTKVLAQLNLTAAQKTRIAALDKKLAEDLQKLQQAPGDRQAKAPTMRELRQKHQQDTQAVLTPAQRTRFQELMREEMRKLREQRGKGKGGGS